MENESKVRLFQSYLLIAREREEIIIIMMKGESVVLLSDVIYACAIVQPPSNKTQTATMIDTWSFQTKKNPTSNKLLEPR